MVLFAILMLALSRAEIIERMKAPPVYKVDGLVEVVANCPSDMRSEFQLPIASFAADVCTSLYRGTGTRQVHFQEPGVVVYIGDVRTNVTDVVSRRRKRGDGGYYTRIFVPAPGYADLERFRLEVAKAFFIAVKGEEVDDERAAAALRESVPGYRVNERYERIDRWMRGDKVESDDEEMLRLQRSVLQLGVARVSDVLRFASRLYLYPEVYSSPFCGKYHCCNFREAIEMSRRDLRIRFLALEKSSTVVAFGGGRGDALLAAATAYSQFLRELAAGKRTQDELVRMLDDADVKLNVAMEEARKMEKGERP